MAQMETTAYYAFGVPLYAALVGVEYLVARRKHQSIISFAPSYGNLTAGLGSIVVGLFLGPALVWLYEFGLNGFAFVHWPDGSLVPWILAIVLADFAHFAHHRLDHRVAACWAVHGVHHMPEEMNFTVAMRHAWFSDIYSWPFYAPLPLLGVHASHFFLATTLLSFHALITHTAQFNFPSLGIFVTPRSHILHHARNPRYLDKNFGAMFCVWDKLLGTHVELDPLDPPEYGTVRGYATHDGAMAQYVLWKDLVSTARKATTIGDKIRVFFSRPGWTPAGITESPLLPPPESRSIVMGIKVYVAFQFALTLVFSLYVFLFRDEHSWTLKLGAAAAILITIITLGGLLDRRKAALTLEGARILATALFFALF